MVRSSHARLFVLPFLVCACHSWSTVPLAPKVSAELPPNSRVVQKGSAPVSLFKARATTDSIVGWRGSQERFAVSRDDVVRVEQRHFATARTIQLVAGVAAGLFTALYVAWETSGGLLVPAP
jgi:hypothetical protein